MKINKICKVKDLDRFADSREMVKYVEQDTGGSSDNESSATTNNQSRFSFHSQRFLKWQLWATGL